MYVYIYIYTYYSTYIYNVTLFLEHYSSVSKQGNPQNHITQPFHNSPEAFVPQALHVAATTFVSSGAYQYCVAIHTMTTITTTTTITTITTMTTTITTITILTTTITTITILNTTITTITTLLRTIRCHSQRISHVDARQPRMFLSMMQTHNDTKQQTNQHYVSLSLYIYIYVYMYVYTYTHTYAHINNVPINDAARRVP